MSIIPDHSAFHNLALHVAENLRVLWEPGEVREVRIPTHGRAGTISGYFDDPTEAARALIRYDGRVPGIYVTLNPVDPALLARAANRLRARAKETTSDAQVVRRTWIGLDFDPVRPSGVSSTNEEHEAALARAREARAFLAGHGWPDPVLADSGNGAHLLYRVDLPPDDASRELVDKVLRAVAVYLADDRISVDLKVGNAARIWKVYGTMACKGDNTKDRPHRRARIVELPGQLKVVPVDRLEAVAALAPTPQAPPQRQGGRFDLERWLADHQVPVEGPKPWGDGRKWVFPVCPWNPDHTNRSAYVVQFSSGAIAAGCHHNSCAGNGWRELRALYEPEAQKTPRHETGHRPAEAALRPDLVRLSDVTPEEVSWLWYPYIPAGKLTLLEGDPQVGKTWLALQLAALVSTGDPFPDPARKGAPGPRRPPANVVYMTAEDGLGDTLRPRLEACGADVNRIYALRGRLQRDEETGEEIERPIWLSNLEELRQVMEEVRPALVVVDPLQAYLGERVDMHRANEVRPILSGVARLAEEYGCAVLLVRHLGKSPQDRPIYRGLGSIDFAAAARSILLAGIQEDTGARILAHTKSSLAEAGPSMAYAIRGGRFYWEGISDVTAAALLAPAPDPEEKSAVEEAADWLRDALEDGPMPSKVLIKEAKASGIAEITLRRAKERLGVRALRQSAAGQGRGRGEWVWILDSQDDDVSKGTPDDHLDHLDQTPTGTDFPGTVQDDPMITLDDHPRTPSSSEKLQHDQDDHSVGPRAGVQIALRPPADSEAARRIIETPPDRPCAFCGGRGFWREPEPGKPWRCARCHPPHRPDVQRHQVGGGAA